MTKRNSSDNLATRLNKITKVHFIYAGLLAAQIIIYDASKLITPHSVLNRWRDVALLLVVTTAVWYLAKGRLAHSMGYAILTIILAAADIALASSFVYSQRGMASRAVLLYLIAIATIAILRSKSALMAAAAISVAAYSTVAITYFVVNFNEGYKVELYGEVGFYSAMFFVFAGLLWTACKPSRPK